MNFYVTIGILLLMIFLSIFKSYRLRTSDKISLLLEVSTFSKINLSFFAFISAFLGFLLILNKGTFQFNIFWFLLSVFWFYMLNQRKVVLEKGIGLRDSFKNSIYLIPFNTMTKVEKIKKNKLKISYLHNNKEYSIKIFALEDSMNTLIQIIRKKTKIKIG